jgi:hypothetical protein
MRYDRTIIAYHGCDAEIAERLLRGEPFKKSQNDYDWLGEGIYFWEYRADRALRFAHDQKRRGKLETPAIVGALVQLGRCFDLMDTRFTNELSFAFERCRQLYQKSGAGCRRTGPTPTTRSGAGSSRARLPTQEVASDIKATSRSPSGTRLASWASSGPH